MAHGIYHVEEFRHMELVILRVILLTHYSSYAPVPFVHFINPYAFVCSADIALVHSSGNCFDLAEVPPAGDLQERKSKPA